MPNALKIITDPGKFSAQEQAYLKLRQKEGRIYKDEQVKQLPNVPTDHPLQLEWRVRKNTSDKLVKYLATKQKPFRILEIGCGNGWLSYTLSKVKGSDVTGIDINMPELEQAVRAFSNIENIQFMYANIFEASFEKEFDMIVVASVIQYFPAPEKLIDRLLQLANKYGEIHILDSPLYMSEKESEEARKRSAEYFLKQGASSMSQYYFHHNYSFLGGFNFRVINPSLLDKLKRRAPFPWVVINKL